MATTTLDPPRLERLLPHRERFLRMLAGWLGSRSEAEDVLHDAFEKMLRTGAGPSSEERLTAWFARVLRNAALDRLRRRGAERRAKSGWAQEASRAPDPDEAERSVCRCVLGVIEELKPSYAEVLRLVDVEGKSPRDAAVALQTTSGNVRVRLHRARTALRERLHDVCGVCAEHGCIDCHCRHDHGDGHRSDPSHGVASPEERA